MKSSSKRLKAKIPAIMLKNNDGIILIDKNEGETSFDIVKKAKKIFKNKKIGHAGTLDPFATGLLIILFGQGTKLSSYLMTGKKRYLATMILGVETDTLDKTGRIVKTIPAPHISPEEIRHVIQGFTGDIEQTPPLYSAINYRGQRAYKLARQGIDMQLKKRAVKIHSIDILSVDLPDITFEVTCSSGTYIRSLAVDIGKSLGSTAHLRSLRRESSGIFQVKDAVDSKMMAECLKGADVKDKTISLKDALADMKECFVDREWAKRIINGCRPGRGECASWDPLLGDYSGFVKLTHGESLVAIIELNGASRDDRAWFKSIRVFT